MHSKSHAKRECRCRCRWQGMCAAWAQAVCSEASTLDVSSGVLAHGHSRSGFCFVNSVARVPACLAGSRGFDSRTKRQINAAVAQLVERRPEEPGVESSNPSCGTNQCQQFCLLSSVDSEHWFTKPGVARSSRAGGAISIQPQQEIRHDEIHPSPHRGPSSSKIHRSPVACQCAATPRRD